MKIFSLLFIIPFAFLSCKQVDNPKEQLLKWAKKGEINESVSCKSDPSQTYCLYLPSNYETGKVYPIIYAFDPHGKGHIPVSLIKKTAENLGYIVVGSNNSRNGLIPDELNHILSTLIADTQNKLAIDSKRVYLIGFSGGARVACMVAQGVSGVKGVIACSAGFQPSRNYLSFHFIGVAGSRDMNYLEMRKLNGMLDSLEIPNQFIVFNGKHQWPNESTISEAITMLEIYSMKESVIPKDLQKITDYLNSNKGRIEMLKSYGNTDSLALAFSISRRTIQILEGIANLEELKSTDSKLESNSEVRKYLGNQLELEKYEEQKQNEFIESFGSKPQTWWDDQIKQLNDEKLGVKGDVSKRLLGFISLSCYGYVNRALQSHNWETANYFTSIYSQVDPENPDSWYAMACLQANTNKAKDAIASLKKAISFGYSDFTKMKADPLLINLSSLPEFGEITKK